MDKVMKGRALKYGDNINTDIISPPQYMELSIPESAQYAMSAVDPDFYKKIKVDTILVAGSNFGSGSSRETSPLTLKYLGLKIIVAKFFARIFYRNGINLGLVLLECQQADAIHTNDVIEIDLQKGEICNLTKSETYSCSRIPDHILSLIEDGGLAESLKKKYQGNDF